MSRIGPREPVRIALSGRLSLADLLWLGNTRHGPAGHWHVRLRGGESDHDHLASAPVAVRYLADHGVPVPDGEPTLEDLADLRIVRSVVEALADGLRSWPPAAAALIAATSFRLGEHGAIRGEGEGWGAFVRDLVVVAVALTAAGTPVRRCANPSCRLLFLDASRNHARRWCDDAGCGNRARVSRARRGSAAPGWAQPPR